MSDNFCILAHNTRVAQLLNRVIRIGAVTGYFFELCGCGSKKSITDGIWL